MKESPTPDIGFILNALAESLAHSIDLPEADSIRKQLAHVDLAIPLPEAVDQGIYSHDWSARTYETLCWEARKVLALGRSVILDASFIRRRDRDMMVQTASEVGATVFFVECLCPPSVALSRLTERWQKRVEGNQEKKAHLLQPSDGRPELYDAQRSQWEYISLEEEQELRHVVVETEHALSVSVERVLEALHIPRFACWLDHTTRRE